MSLAIHLYVRPQEWGRHIHDLARVAPLVAAVIAPLSVLFDIPALTVCLENALPWIRPHTSSLAGNVVSKRWPETNGPICEPHFIRLWSSVQRPRQRVIIDPFLTNGSAVARRNMGLRGMLVPQSGYPDTFIRAEGG